METAFVTPSGADIPDFARQRREHGIGDSDDAFKNIDPHNEAIGVDEQSELSVRGQAVRLEGGSTKCARVMASFLEGQDWAGKSVLEVGAGTGLMGIALAIAGARVDLTDQEYVVELLQHNVNRNLTAAQRERARCFELVWGPDAPAQSAAPYDAIIAADLVYAKEAHAPLLETFAAVAGERTEIFFAYIHRFPWEERFFQMMDEGHERALIHYEDGIWIYRFTRREA